MTDLNFLAVLVAAVAGFVVSGVYYGMFASQLAQLHSAYAGAEAQAWPSVGTIVVEILRNLVVAAAVSIISTRLGISGGPALLLAAGLWLAFPAVLFVGSIIHENYSRRLAAIHAGDWLLKIIVITLIVSWWR
ncbi:MAG: DUF1761 domain-containing protein [bacterium]